MLHTAKRYSLKATEQRPRRPPGHDRKFQRAKPTLSALAVLLVAISPQSLLRGHPGRATDNESPSRAASRLATRTLFEQGGVKGTTVTFAPLHGPAGPVHRVSTHWAGYIDTGAGSSFTAVQATWVQPRIRCNRPNSSAAFWIGLGGAPVGADGLEQIGTSADCSEELLPSYSAWYELIPIPAAPIQLPITVAPGDRLTAQVNVRGGTVTLAMRNLSTGGSFSTQTTAPRLDLTSAEWIAEAPSFCLIDCTPLALADFGTVNFKRATASGDTHTGTINDPSWTHQPIKLFTTPFEPSAIPSALSPNGRAFSVRWRDTTRRPG